MDAGDKRSYDNGTNAQLLTAQVWDGGGYHVKQSVNRWSRTDRWSRIALAAVLTGALGLAACGRKGPLDPPPSAGLTPNTAYAPMPSLGESHEGVPFGGAIAPPPPPAAPAPPPGAPPAPPPPQKTFFLDFLLGK
jgi:predicted small lipoprotein YifL